MIFFDSILLLIALFVGLVMQESMIASAMLSPNLLVAIFVLVITWKTLARYLEDAILNLLTIKNDPQSEPEYVRFLSALKSLNFTAKIILMVLLISVANIGFGAYLNIAIGYQNAQDPRSSVNLMQLSFYFQGDVYSQYYLLLLILRISSL